MSTRRRNKNSWITLLRRTALIGAVVLLAAVIFETQNIYIRLNRPDTIKSAAVSSVTSKPTLRAELPIQLKIPIINVDAAIAYVGLKSDGTMEIDPNPDQVAWYEFGPRPGEKGNAVIAGHYGWTGEKPSVFNNLQKLNSGDEVLVIGEKGSTTTFVVRESRKYDPNADAANVFFSKDDKSHLNLITCDGTWESDQKTYSDRLVIFTDKKTD